MALITCPECNSEISDQATSCPKCGFPLRRESEGTELKANEKTEKRTKPKKKTRISFVITVLILGAIAAFIIIRFGKVYNQAKGGGEVSFTDMIPQKKQVKLFDGTIIVKSGQWRYKEFNTLKSWDNIRVKGDFKASGGSGNDIRALIMTKNAFTNFTNGHQAYSVYDSGKLTVSDIDVRLPSATQNYVLAFDNTFSLVTDKEIGAHIDLIYTF